jgi:hypothetical protein
MYKILAIGQNEVRIAPYCHHRNQHGPSFPAIAPSNLSAGDIIAAELEFLPAGISLKKRPPRLTIHAHQKT